MPSYRSIVAATVVSTIGLINCQYVINPNSVDSSTRAYWCAQQTTECPLICLQMPDVTSETTEANSCDPTNLSYACVCSNGLSPNISQYSQTLPYFVCTEWGTQCVTACGQDSSCASLCRSGHPCGAQSPTRVNTSTISTMDATAAATGVVYTGLSGVVQQSSDQSSDASATVLRIGQSYGGFVLVTGIVGCLALLL